MHDSGTAGTMAGLSAGFRTIRFSWMGLLFGAFLLVVNGICKAVLIAEKESALFFLSPNSFNAVDVKPLLYEVNRVIYCHLNHSKTNSRAAISVIFSSPKH